VPLALCPRPLQIHTGSGDPWELKAIDFGAGTFFREGEPLTEVVGSPHYVAPEVLRWVWKEMGPLTRKPW
jgi:hypothetical protein